MGDAGPEWEGSWTEEHSSSWLFHSPNTAVIRASPHQPLGWYLALEASRGGGASCRVPLAEPPGPTAGCAAKCGAWLSTPARDPRLLGPE